MQDCSISSVLAMEILQSYTKPSIYNTLEITHLDNQYHATRMTWIYHHIILDSLGVITYPRPILQEELMDETKTINEVKPFQLFLKVVTKSTNKADIIINNNISNLIGVGKFYWKGRICFVPLFDQIYSLLTCWIV